jgi:hypothetical protein
MPGIGTGKSTSIRKTVSQVATAKPSGNLPWKIMQHGRPAALVFSLETGLVSPQFHVAFDPSFRTIKELKAKSQWQIKAGFVMRPSMIQERARGTSKTRRDESSANMHSNSKGASKTRKRKRKSQETIDAGGEGDPETRKERARAAAESTNDGTSRLKIASGSTIEQADRRSGQRRRSSRKANPPPDLVQAMMAELMAFTQTDIPGEINTYQAMFPEHEHDHINLFQAYKAVSDPDTLYCHQAGLNKSSCN